MDSPVASLGLATPGAATDGVTLLKKNWRPFLIIALCKVMTFFSCRPHNSHHPTSFFSKFSHNDATDHGEHLRRSLDIASSMNIHDCGRWKCNGNKNESSGLESQFVCQAYTNTVVHWRVGGALANIVNDISKQYVWHACLGYVRH